MTPSTGLAPAPAPVLRSAASVRRDLRVAAGVQAAWLRDLTAGSRPRVVSPRPA